MNAHISNTESNALRMLSQIASLIFLTLVLGCGSSGSAIQTGAETTHSATQVKEGDYAPRQNEEAPPPQAGSPIIWVVPPPLEMHTISPAEYSEPTARGDVNQPTEGYRVQVYSGRESTTARRIFAQIRSITGLEAYLNYEAPQYKVRVGDFVSRDDANLLLQQIRRQGYPEAWVIKSTVNLSK